MTACVTWVSFVSMIKTVPPIVCELHSDGTLDVLGDVRCVALGPIRTLAEIAGPDQVHSHEYHGTPGHLPRRVEEVDDDPIVPHFADDDGLKHVSPVERPTDRALLYPHG